MLEQRKQELNDLFGFIPWRGHVSHRPLSSRSASVQQLYDANLSASFYQQQQQHQHDAASKFFNFTKASVTIGNTAYVILFGFWLGLIYLFVGILCLASLICIPHGMMAFKLASYYMWPFATVVVIRKNNDDEEQHVVASRIAQGTREWLSRFFFILLFGWILLLAHFGVILVCWFAIVLIPCAKMFFYGLVLLVRHHPSHVAFVKGSKLSDEVYLINTHAFNVYYLKYNVLGMNVTLASM